MKTKIGIITTFTILAAVFSGCATKPLTMNYSPSSVLSAEGAVTVGDFEYRPGKSGSVKPNQIRNTAIGEVIFEKDIDLIIEESIFKELRFVGVKTQSKDVELTGEVIEFLIDDLGFSVDWTLEINYQIKSINDGRILYDSTKKIEKNTNKFGNVFGTLNEIIKLNIEELIQDPEFIETIN